MKGLTYVLMIMLIVSSACVILTPVGKSEVPINTNIYTGLANFENQQNKSYITPKIFYGYGNDSDMPSLSGNSGEKVLFLYTGGYKKILMSYVNITNPSGKNRILDWYEQGDTDFMSYKKIAYDTTGEGDNFTTHDTIIKIIANNKTIFEITLELRANGNGGIQPEINTGKTISSFSNTLSIEYLEWNSTQITYENLFKNTVYSHDNLYRYLHYDFHLHMLDRIRGIVELYMNITMKDTSNDEKIISGKIFKLKMNSDDLANYVIQIVNKNSNHLNYEDYSTDNLAIDNIKDKEVIQLSIKAPTDLNAKTNLEPSVYLSWKGIDSYAIEYYIYKDGKFFVSTYNTYYKDTNVTYGEEVKYYVKAVISDYNWDGRMYYPEQSDPSNEIDIIIPTLNPPTNVYGKLIIGSYSSNPKIKLTWTADNSTPEFKIYRGNSPTNLKFIGTTTTDTYYDNTVEWGTTYYYAVSSYNPNNNYESQKSSSVEIQIPPSPPHNVEITADNTPSIHLSWSAVNGATSYKIYKGTSSNKESYIATVKAPQTTYTDVSVVSGKTYYYYVTSVSSNGLESPPSNEVSITIAVHKYLAPKNVKAVVLKDSDGNLYVHITWSKISNADYYKIYKGTRSGNEVFIAKSDTGYYNDYSIIINGTYYYYVTAVYGTVESGHSNEISIKVIENATSSGSNNGGSSGSNNGGSSGSNNGGVNGSNNRIGNNGGQSNINTYITAGSVITLAIIGSFAYRRRKFYKK